MLQALIISSVSVLTVSNNLTSGLLEILILQGTEQPKFPADVGRSFLKAEAIVASVYG